MKSFLFRFDKNFIYVLTFLYFIFFEACFATGKYFDSNFAFCVYLQQMLSVHIQLNIKECRLQHYKQELNLTLIAKSNWRKCFSEHRVNYITQRMFQFVYKCKSNLLNNFYANSLLRWLCPLAGPQSGHSTLINAQHYIQIYHYELWYKY